MRVAKWLAVGLSLAALPFLGGMSSRPQDIHLYLEGSIPEEDSAVTALPEIVLWFSQVPWPNTTEISLYDVDAKKQIEVRAVQDDPDDPFTYRAAIAAPLPPGRYQIWWGTRSDDGVPAPLIGGLIPFVVKSP